jgi:hypothetical protein
MEQLVLVAMIVAGVSMAVYASKLGLGFIVDQIPTKPPKG